jgi:hypothetical protein
MAEGLQVGRDLYVRIVRINELREQDLNPQVMQPREMERLTENIRERGSLESLPYCAQPNGVGPIEVVSGHHRVRAARAAGLTEIPVLLDIAPMTRSEIASKQIAHNQLVGTPDQRLLRELLATIETVDDMLRTGVPEDMLPSIDEESIPLGTPSAEFDWRTVIFTFLPHQLSDFNELIKQMDAADLVGVANIEQFDPFAKALGEFMRFRDVKAVGTAIAKLTEIAKMAIERPELLTEWYDEEEGTAHDKEGWVPIATVLGSNSMPAPAAATLKRVVDRLVKEGDVGNHNRWQALEVMAADFEAGAPRPKETV